jgi:hypothetical protein
VQAQVDKVKSHFIQQALDNIPDLYDIHNLESNTELLELIHFQVAGNEYLFPSAECVGGGVHGPNIMQHKLKAANEH